MKKVLQATVRAYQQYISPLFPPSCRYYPTCSTYMIEALGKHGAVKGTMMGVARLCRCHPYAKAGYDLVPNHFTLKRNNDIPPLESC